VLRTSALVSSWLAIGILFLMARQPDWTGSWLTVGVFGIIGLGASMIVGQLQPRAAEQPTLH
jgi:hypothetical protein